MMSRMILAAAGLGTLLSSSAFAEDDHGPSSAAASRMRLQAQVEVLPLGSGKATIQDTSMTRDAATAYGVSGIFDYAVTPFLSIGVAPRLVFNVTPEDNEGDDSDKQLDLRARIAGHYPVMPGVDLYAALSPGYTIVMSDTEGVNSATGFAIGGSVGATYDISPKMFVGAEVGYQRAFTSTDIAFGNQTTTEDLDLSYLHIGVGAGTRF